MKLVEFPESNTVYGKGQEEDYVPLPAFKFENDQQGRIVCCWKLTFWERIKLIFTGNIWHQILTFKKPLQPQLLSIEKPNGMRGM